MKYQDFRPELARLKVLRTSNEQNGFVTRWSESVRRKPEQITASEQFWKEAKDFVAKSGSAQNWYVITREMPKQLEAWGAYFIWRLGFVTRGMEMLTDHKIETFLTPCEWPEWFDSRFSGYQNK